VDHHNIKGRYGTVGSVQRIFKKLKCFFRNDFHNEMASECQICYVKNVKYTIQCGSTVPHQICFDCEREWRLKAKPTSRGRFITCPFCRKEEKEPGLRGRSSYEAELKLLYQQFYSRPSRQLPGWMERSAVPPARPARPAREAVPRPVAAEESDSDEEIPQWVHDPDVYRPQVRARRIPSTCQNVTMCNTRSTSRKCSYPVGCNENVCRTCKMCVSHFQFQPVVAAVSGVAIRV